MKPTTILLAITMLIFSSCSSGKKEAKSIDTPGDKSLVGYVDLTNPLDEDLIQSGTDIFIQKCANCHTIDTVEFKVPSFAGITNRRTPEWIMNMVINIDEMLKQDPVAAELLQKHKKVMPDPNISVDQARGILEFLRNNDMQQVGVKDQAANR